MTNPTVTTITREELLRLHTSEECFCQTLATSCPFESMSEELKAEYFKAGKNLLKLRAERFRVKLAGPIKWLHYLNVRNQMDFLIATQYLKKKAE